MLNYVCYITLILYRHAYYYVFFFFFKQKTAYEMRISDWSSDVCSSDLDDLRRQLIRTAGGVTIEELVEAERGYIRKQGRRVTVASALLDHVNEPPAHARPLAARIRGIQAHVNPLTSNPTARARLRPSSRYQSAERRVGQK